MARRFLPGCSRSTTPVDSRGAGDYERTQKRLRTLIECGVLPATMPRRMFAGQCLEDHSCIACDLTIHLGEQELEWTNPADLILYFHRGCLEIYRTLPDGHTSR